MNTNGRKRVVIEGVTPEINCGDYPIKRVIGESVTVQADIFTDGHDQITAVLLYRHAGKKKWQEIPMQFLVNDRWEAEFTVEGIGETTYTIEAWVDHFKTWQQDLLKRFEAGQNLKVELQIGAEFVEEAAKRAGANDAKKLQAWAKSLTTSKQDEAVATATSDDLTALMQKYPHKQHSARYDKELKVFVDRKKALFSAWYEPFPRSVNAATKKHGTFKDCEKLLPEIKELGFDIIYFPPIHPIGKTNRKGKNNSPTAKPGEPGSPWAIGAKEGGHKAIHPQLGTFKDFERLVKKANELDLEIALDLAYQCSPDHPYVKEHPEWFRWRPDGTVQYAENPPKKYQDVLPINFESENWQELWEELKSVVEFWIEKGVHVFRVDNPHTKPFAFWEWLIAEIKRDYPDVLFLSEAFTRPKVMYRLAKLGFTQSYTYFTWRNTKHEFMQYLTELTRTHVRDIFRPNFWPNTPDILPEHLQVGGKPAFVVRLVLAATLSSNYGVYGPAYELCVNDALEGKEEYLDSEKYEIKNWNRDEPGNIKSIMANINQIRKDNPALQTTWNVHFYDVDNEDLLCYGKLTDDLSNIIVVVVNLDYFHTQTGHIQIPIGDLGIPEQQPYLVHELLSDHKYIWHGEKNYIELDPQTFPAHIFRIHKRLRREHDFDYFM